MAGRYKPYPEYKDSGVDWIGKIPCDWDMWKITHACPYVASGTTPKADGDVYYGGENLWVTTGELREGVIFDTLKKVTDKALLDMPTLRLHPRGSVSIAMYGATIGRLGIFGKEAATNQACCVMPPSATIQNKYLFYWLYATRQEIINLSSGGGQPNVNQEKIASLKVSCPNYNLQTTIANFLDHETAKIDTLIEKQQQLIQLLKEKRQAVISHAVTKGLNPKVKMRDSGVEWLGEVPEHWKVSKFGYVSMVVRGGSPRPAGDPELFNGDYSPWVTVAEITKDDEVYLTETETFLTKKGSEQCRVFSSGTLLISNSGATLGVPKILSINANANDGVVGFENLKLDHEFSYFYLSTLTDDLRERIKQGSGQPNLNTDIVKNIAVPIPPKSEISEIVTLIRNTREQYANLTTRATAGIELLQERRTALISAAVTGKIDIRNWVAPKESQTNKEVAA